MTLILLDAYAIVVEVKSPKVSEGAAKGLESHVATALRRTYHEGWGAGAQVPCIS